MKASILGAARAGILVVASGAAQAALIDRGGGLIYDTELNVTWLSDANYAQTTGYDADGRMNWIDATAWAANLTYYDSVRNVTYDDWRLPTSNDCSGSSCIGNDLGYLFYRSLGGVYGTSILYTTDIGLFTNVRSNNYWSAYDFHWSDGYNLHHYAYHFDTSIGSQTASSIYNSYYAWALRSGDVAAATSTVPVPAAAWLLGSGLLWGWSV